MPRLDRQSDLFSPAKLAKGQVTIFGDGPITNHLVAYLAGLGVGKMNLVGKGERVKRKDTDPAEFLLQLSKSRRKDKVNCIAEIASKISPETGIKPYHSEQDRAFTLGSKVVVDTTNDPESKYRAFMYCERTDKLYISCSSSQLSATVTTHDSGKGKDGRRTPLENIVLKEYQHEAQGSFTSGFAAALAADEIRKRLCPVEGDRRFQGTISYSLLDQARILYSRLPRNTVRSKRNAAVHASAVGKKALVVGAGGIGTHVLLSLAALFTEIEIYDHDHIEDHNLNRQFLYFDAIGENKAKTAAQRLRRISPRLRINAHPSRLTEEELVTKRRASAGYDAVFSCLDSAEPRRMLDKYCKITETPLFNAGVNTYIAKADHFIPGKTHCLECRKDFRKRIDRQNEIISCADLPANVVMPNALAGALMVADAMQVFTQVKIPASYGRTVCYNSNSPVLTFSVEKDRLLCRNPRYLRRDCLCHEYIAEEYR